MKLSFNPHKLRSFTNEVVSSSDDTLPLLPKNYLEWIDYARPIVEGKVRTFLIAPQWVPIYEDNHPWIMVMNGRQTYKSTYATDILACDATSERGVQVCYASFDDQSRSSFSNQKLRVGTFMENPLLSRFPRRGKSAGNVGEISLKNDSTIYCTTDNYEYRHVEGKSIKTIILDEAQYQDVQYVPKVVQTMMATKGKLKILGIGGEAGSPYEDLWLKTDQREWIYDHPNWRELLQFDEKGLIIGDYLRDALAGHWKVNKPENYMYHGYHMPQTMFATIPLTIESAIRDYKIHPMYSIEYQQKNYPSSIFLTHVMGTFYKATRRPITREMVLACMNPYKYLGLSSIEDIAEIKTTYGESVKITMGVDFGSGNPSNTVIAIIIWWRKSDRYQLAFLDKRPGEHQLDQAELITSYFVRSNCDVGVGDLGYGANQVKLIQDGGANRITGTLYAGVGRAKFLGCRTIGNEVKPITFTDDKTDEHGDEEIGRLTIDKTTAIQNFIDMIETMRSHPIRDIKVPQLMIPFLTEREYDTDWLIRDFTDITRKDLERIEENATTDPRSKAKKEFNHPKDSVMAIIYAILATRQEASWHWGSVGIH